MESAVRSQKRVMALSAAATIAVLLLLAAFASGMLSAGAAVSPTPTTNPPLHQTPPITAGGFGEHEDCDDAATTDLFHFVLPGPTAKFTAFSATFRLPDGSVVTYTLGTSSNVQLVQNGKGINVTVEAGSTLLGASATTTTPVRFFNLSHTCAAGGGPSPSPSVSPSPSPSVEPTPSPSVEPSGSPSPGYP